MTTTSTFSGIQDESKTSSRCSSNSKVQVLKPPGGGSSNIFGPSDSSPSHKARPGACKPSEAGVFTSTSDSSMKSAAQRSARDGDDSFNRLFGANNAAQSPLSLKCLDASSRVNTHDNLFGGDISPPTRRGSTSKSSSTHDHIFGESSTGSGEGFQSRYTDFKRGHYNPITGADYKDLAPNHHALHVKELPKPQKEQPPLPCSDEQYQAKGGKMQNVQTSTRITNPPGGKTHKLW